MPKREDIKSILIIGAGPIVIGQACEFDYSGTQACKALKEDGYRVILVNSNPATIMTDPELADATYIEPITPELVAQIIEKEQPDALLPTMGGQTALNCTLALHENGVLAQHGVELIGANVDAIAKAEDRQLFGEAMARIGLQVPRNTVAHSLEEAKEALKDIGLPAIIRPSYTLGGAGGGVAATEEEFERIVLSGIEASLNNQVLIDASLLGWKEYEMEVVRDKQDNCIIVCSIENVDPMGVHTGDSITVAPALTLTDKEYQRMRDASLAVLREIGVETGGSNVQFAVNPADGQMVVIEMNPRVSRSSALASKATGFPIAKVAAKLAVGYTLDEIQNDCTGVTPASFEPVIDYVVTKIPRFTFEKFSGAKQELSSAMKSVGEVMAIGGTFAESLQKALRSLETGLSGLDEMDYEGGLKPLLAQRSPDRLLLIAQALREGMGVEQLQAITQWDPWFLEQIAGIVAKEKHLLEVVEQYRKGAQSISSPLRGEDQGGGDKNLSSLSRTLRKNTTDAEKKLWEVLRKKQIEGVKFRRQHPMGEKYVVDFVCLEKKLVIELNGGQHAEQQDYDEKRTRFLDNEGYRVLRFWNNEVLQNLEGVYDTIERVLVTPTLTLPPQGGGDNGSSLSQGGGDVSGATLVESVFAALGDALLELKKYGFSDARIAALTGCSSREVMEARHALNVRPVFKRVDTCAAEFAALTPYMYATYWGTECESEPSDAKKAVILGSGPNRIGQGVEFDYACVHAAYALVEAGFETIMVNCNPETVSTDYDTSDRLYFEPLTEEDVIELVHKEQQKGTVVGVNLQFGGQTPLKLAKALGEAGIPILGTPPDVIDLAEDRERFQQLLHELELVQPRNAICHSEQEVAEKVEEIGYPVVVRPSYVLGGRAMAIVHDADGLAAYMREARPSFTDGPILVDSFLQHAIEVDVDAIADGEAVAIAGVMEHIEEAGIHSGDSACSLPPYSLAPEVITAIEEQTTKLAMALGVVGLMNVQYAIKGDVIYVLEVNPRSSRTVPFVAKATGVPVAKIAARVMAGETLSAFPELAGARAHQENVTHIAVKEAVFPFARFEGVDVILGPEMKSTGEVMGIDNAFDAAYAKAQIASGMALPTGGTAFISVKDEDKEAMVFVAETLREIGFDLIATGGTATFLQEKGIAVAPVNKVLEGSPHIVDRMKEGAVDLVINTTAGVKSIADSFSIRRTALLLKIPYCTTDRGARELVLALRRMQGDLGLEVRALQEYVS